MDPMQNDPGLGAVVSNAINGDEREVDPARKALVNKVIDRVKAAKKHHDPAFRYMDEDAEFAQNCEAIQGNGDANHYVANLVMRHIQERTSVLYAKNPRCKAVRAQRLDFAIWDEDPASLMNAQAVMQAAAAGDLTALQAAQAEVLPLLRDVQQGYARRKMLDKLGQTLVILFQNTLTSTDPSFKKQFKGVTKKAVTQGIGWVKLNLVRAYEPDPETIRQINDVTEQLAHLETLAGQIAEGEVDETSAKREELRTALATLQAQPEVLVEEGIAYTFPENRRVILDPRTRQIGTFKGCNWLAEEYLMTPDEIRDVYKVDVGKKFTAYHRREGESQNPPVVGEGDEGKDPGLGCVWEVYDKKTRQVYVVCDGYDDFLKEPAAPDVKIRRFYPYFSLMFNEGVATDKRATLYPQSDVRLLFHSAKEYNRMREALRQHRIASAPFYAGQKGVLGDEDKMKLRERHPHDVIELAVPPNTDIKTVIQSVPVEPIDPNLYEVENVFSDMERTTGSQAAVFGGPTSKTSATEASISEGSRVTTMASATDDTDECLTEIASAAGEVMLLEYSPETVKRIVGPGAVWPEMSRQDIADEIYLEIVAGSSGRPNRAQDLANMERAAPFLIQIPGISPKWLAERYVTILDDTIDLADAILDGIPSIVAMNALSGKNDGGRPEPGTGDAESNPSDQGDDGGQNNPRAGERPPGPQPAFPAPAANVV